MVPSVLLLGPSGGGKTCLFRAACALVGERFSLLLPPPAPTRGLVRRVLDLPISASSSATANGQECTTQVLLCDAGGQRPERRHWVELVRAPARVGALIFVVDIFDDVDETRDLWRQLVNAKWARDATLLLALTRFDVALQQPGGDAAAADLVDLRAAEFRSACQTSHAFAVHPLCTHDKSAAARLFADAANGAARTLSSSALPASGPHVSGEDGDVPVLL